MNATAKEGNVLRLAEGRLIGLQVAEMLTARGALAAAHAGTRLPGSSTACVLRLNRLQRTVETANLVRRCHISVYRV